jgi:hypothetical protein
MGEKNVVIRDKNGAELCVVRCPQPVVSVHEWTAPNSVIEWAWAQAVRTVTYWQEKGITTVSIAGLPATACVACKDWSVQPRYIKLPFMTRIRIHGVQCENPKCTMYHVTVPVEMLVHLDLVGLMNSIEMTMESYILTVILGQYQKRLKRKGSKVSIYVGTVQSAIL